MKLRVALLPRLVNDVQATACLMIDALRASTSIAVLFARGASSITLAESPRAARRIAHEGKEPSLLCGERGGLPPRGFDYGNSPVEFDELDVSGRPIVLCTTNGTGALRRLSPAPVVLVGALANGGASVRALLREAAKRGLDATLVCAGLEQGMRVALEDTFVAGALVARALTAACDEDVDFALSDDAIVALRAYRAYRGNALAAFRQSEHGRALIALGFERDLAFCARADTLEVVPRLTVEPPDRLTLARK